MFQWLVNTYFPSFLRAIYVPFTRHLRAIYAPFSRRLRVVYAPFLAHLAPFTSLALCSGRLRPADPARSGGGGGAPAKKKNVDFARRKMVRFQSGHFLAVTGGSGPHGESNLLGTFFWARRHEEQQKIQQTPPGARVRHCTVLLARLSLFRHAPYCISLPGHLRCGQRGSPPSQAACTTAWRLPFDPSTLTGPGQGVVKFSRLSKFSGLTCLKGRVKVIEMAR